VNSNQEIISRADVLSERFARNLEAIREHYGWSLAALAARAGLSQNIVKHLLRRGSNPGIASVLRLANAVGIRLSRMLDEQPIQVGMLPPEDSIVRCYDDPDAVAAAIGPRSRAYRQRDNWSRRKFVAHSGISKGTLHYLETNSVEPTLSVVDRVAAAFGMSLADFVEIVESPVIAISRSASSASDRSHQHLLQHTEPAERVELDDCRLEGRQRMSSPASPAGSTAMLYVVEGSIRVSFETEHHLLRDGDAVLVMADRPFTIASTTAAPARFLRFSRLKGAVDSHPVLVEAAVS